MTAATTTLMRCYHLYKSKHFDYESFHVYICIREIIRFNANIENLHFSFSHQTFFFAIQFSRCNQICGGCIAKLQ